ncbi:hypothetical protein EDB86DRAFT_2830505 [Lactarius hatsudake]|nr:hypothetical protein EDB86DRAFT_2830505 [Lactarius hatsudake]
MAYIAAARLGVRRQCQLLRLHLMLFVLGECKHGPASQALRPPGPSEGIRSTYEGLAREAKGQVVTAVASGSSPVLHRLSQIHTVARDTSESSHELLGASFEHKREKDEVFRPSSKNFGLNFFS